LLEFSKDPKYVLSTLLNSTSHISFQNLSGLPLLQDRLSISTKSSPADRQHTETIGEGVQLLFGSSDTTKTVHIQADWIATWSKAANATLFVFPHRRCELERYRWYIMDIFVSSANHVHERVILLDWKLQKKVAGRRNIELCDFSPSSHGSDLSSPTTAPPILHPNQKQRLKRTSIH
ncbi:hypothetical protein B0H10DRAFT_1773923, partial [Mycena sp. CBHHK59/15]